MQQLSWWWGLSNLPQCDEQLMHRIHLCRQSLLCEYTTALVEALELAVWYAVFLTDPTPNMISAGTWTSGPKHMFGVNPQAGEHPILIVFHRRLSHVACYIGTHVLLSSVQLLESDFFSTFLGCSAQSCWADSSIFSLQVILSSLSSNAASATSGRNLCSVPSMMGTGESATKNRPINLVYM